MGNAPSRSSFHSPKYSTGSRTVDVEKEGRGGSRRKKAGEEGEVEYNLREIVRVDELGGSNLESRLEMKFQSEFRRSGEV